MLQARCLMTCSGNRQPKLSGSTGWCEAVSTGDKPSRDRLWGDLGADSHVDGRAY
jgi:hypothetical protein